MIKNNFFLSFLILISINGTLSDRIRYPNLTPTPKNWSNECAFFNKAKLRALLEDYLAVKEKICERLDFCPKVPDWINQEQINYYNNPEMETDNLNLIPSFKDGKPLELFYKFFIENISSMNLQKSKLRIDFFVEMLWFIPKKVCEDYFKILKDFDFVEANATEVEVEVNFFRYFWLPDTYIANSLTSVKPIKPVDTRSLQINIENLNDSEVPFCYVSYQTKDAVTILCDMDFHVYPFDEQICSIKIRSFSFDNESIILHWESMDWDKALQLPGYSVLLRHNKSITEEWLGENYSVLYVEIVISRHLINLLVGVYFSTFLIVIIMISTFWLNSFFITDRINIGVISVLALYDQYNESKKNLPSIGYIQPLAYWIIICMLFVFAQLFQNSIFYYIALNKKSLTNKRNKINPFKKNQISDLNAKETADNDRKEFLHVFISVPLDKTSLDYIPMKFDAISRLTFCVFLIFFLAIYWPNAIKLSYSYNLLNR